MLDNLVTDRVERWKSKELFERKGVALKELNRELESETRELDMLLEKKRTLYEATGKEEDDDDHDEEDSSLNGHTSDSESSESASMRMERLSVRLQVRNLIPHLSSLISISHLFRSLSSLFSFLSLISPPALSFLPCALSSFPSL
jgi:hypothetical protein